MKRLYKVEEGKMVAGVCQGIAEYFGIDASLVRLLVALICCWKGIGLILYIVAAIILPTKSEVEYLEKFVDGKTDIHYED